MVKIEVTQSLNNYHFLKTRKRIFLCKSKRLDSLEKLGIGQTWFGEG